jgi:predicted ATPase/Tfp pilus assembly protein PilF
MMMNILQQSPADLQIIRPNISDALNDLLYRMLEKSPDARIPSVRLVGAALESIIKGTAKTPTKSLPPITSGSAFDTLTPTTTQRPNNFPAQTTPFVGREHELAELTKLLKNPQIRLITILAPGGMGKTRLSLEAAGQLLNIGFSNRTASTRFPNGAYFVPLAPLSSPEGIVTAVADAVNFQFYPGGEPKQQLLDFFREKNMLLLLDNFEHLLAGADLVSDILATAPGVKVLATSRERLNLGGETIFNLEGMDFPDWETPEDALEFSAVKLFMQSAKRVRPDFELKTDDLKYVARICRLVQGMPLGILLAAAWVEMLSLEEIAAEIEKSLDFLESEQRDVPTRQRSIRAVFEYSWNLLTEDERAVFQKLSVFRGGFTREAAQIVAGANLRVLMALVNKSLLRRDASNGRYEVHEMLRQYAEEQLEKSGGAEATCGTHSTYYIDFLDQQYAAIASKTPKQAMAAISGEFENIQAAWDWAIKCRHLDSINKAIAPLKGMTELLSQFREGGERFLAAAVRLSPAPDPKTELLIVRLRLAYGWLAGRIGDFDVMRATGEEGLPLFQQANSKPDVEAALGNLGHAAMGQGRYAEAQHYMTEALSLARERDNKPIIYMTITSMAWGIFLAGRYEEARQIYEAEMSGVDAMGIPMITVAYRQQLGEVLHALGENAAAKKLFEEALVVSKDMGTRRMTAYIFTSLGNVAHSAGHFEEARHYYEESLVTFRDIGDRVGVAEALTALGGGFFSLGEYLQSKQANQEALVMYRDIGDIRGTANSLAQLGVACRTLGEFVQALTYFEECLVLRRQMGNRVEIIDVLGHLSRTEVYWGNFEAGINWNEQILDYRQEADSIPMFWASYKGNQLDILTRMGDFQAVVQTIEYLKSVFPLEKAPKFGQVVMLNDLGWAQRELGNLVEAERNLRESLQIAAEIHSPPWEMLSIIQLAALTGTKGDTGHAVEWLSFARTNHYTMFSEKSLAEQYLERLQAMLPPDEFAAAIERGKTLMLETVVQQLLDEIS